MLIDLSHTVEHGLVTYKGLPAPIICDYLSREASRKIYAPGTEFQIGKIEMVANTGTYMDSPFHRYADGKDLSELHLEQLANLDAVKVSAVSQPKINAKFLANLAASAAQFKNLRGKAVLVETGWSRHWKTDQYYEGHPFLTEDAAEFLVDAGVVLVGIDSHNIDSTADGTRPVHSTLLGKDVLIVEHMTNLDALPAGGFTFSAVPVKIKGFGTFPVRAFAEVAIGK